MNISGISGFLASVANNYRRHYLDLAQSLASGRTPHYYGRSQAAASTRTTLTPVPVDTYQPTAPTQHPKGSSAVDDHECSDSKTKENDCSKPDSPLQKQPDGTYQYVRTAQLDYSLDLKFSLGAITQTAQRLADGDTTGVDDFAAAGFGLQADLNLEGTQRVKSTNANGLQPGRNRQWSAGGVAQSGATSFANRNVVLNSYYNEATKVNRSLDQSVGKKHMLAVNRVAMRYQFDNRFSMSFLHRFNVQTKQVAEQAPDAVAQYVDTAGDVATKGSAEMMAGFFDAVDDYLNKAEAHLSDKVGSLFDQAAAELGFSGTQVDAAKAHLTGTITSFFDRVDQALATVQAKFTAPATQPQARLAAQYYNPAEAEASQQVAVA